VHAQKIDPSSVPSRKGSGYPSPFDEPCAARTRRHLGNAGGLRDFGVNLMTLPPGGWSSQRHWHSHEDEFVYLLEGELILIEEGSETVLHPGDCAAFPKGTGNGHHLINRSSAMAVYLSVGRLASFQRTAGQTGVSSTHSVGHNDGLSDAGITRLTADIGYSQTLIALRS
jgi:uncharacterized cupin superfamily protein